MDASIVLFLIFDVYYTSLKTEHTVLCKSPEPSFISGFQGPNLVLDSYLEQKFSKLLDVFLGHGLLFNSFSV